MTKILLLPVCILGLLSLSFLGAKKTIEAQNLRYLSKLGSNQVQFQQLIDTIQQQTPYVVYITSGHRSTVHQKKLYAQNSKNAKPGSSPHEFKRALDINLIGPFGWIRKSDSIDTWKRTTVPSIAKTLGFRWGGDFKSYHDPVHFDLPNSG